MSGEHGWPSGSVVLTLTGRSQRMAGATATVANGFLSDTPRMLPSLRNCYRLNGFMAARGNNGGGRRSKGERRLVGTRMSIPDADKLAAVAEAEGMTVSDYVAGLVTKHLRNIQLDNISNQEALPIPRAS